MSLFVCCAFHRSSLAGVMKSEREDVIKKAENFRLSTLDSE
jgi:hypothetical protein